eukprot:s52_g25.t1
MIRLKHLVTTRDHSSGYVATAHWPAALVGAARSNRSGEHQAAERAKCRLILKPPCFTLIACHCWRASIFGPQALAQRGASMGLAAHDALSAGGETEDGCNQTATATMSGFQGTKASDSSPHQSQKSKSLPRLWLYHSSSVIRPMEPSCVPSSTPRDSCAPAVTGNYQIYQFCPNK